MYFSLILSLLCLFLLALALERKLLPRYSDGLIERGPLVTYVDSLEALRQELTTIPHRTSMTILQSRDELHGRSCSDLLNLLATRSSLFDNSLTIDPSLVNKGTVLETKQFELIFPFDVTNAASSVIEDMKQLAQIMLSYNSPITCRLALMQGVRCPQWHEDYVRLRLIKSYLGPGTDWVDPGDKVVRSTNWINVQLDQPLTVPSEKIRHSKEGDILVLAGRRHDSGVVPVLHRSPISSSLERRLLYTITIA